MKATFTIKEQTLSVGSGKLQSFETTYRPTVSFRDEKGQLHAFESVGFYYSKEEAERVVKLLGFQGHES